MSVEAMTWAFAQEVPSSGMKLLLVALANESNKAGVTFAGRALLARDCSCRRETVSANMAKLEEAGLIVRFRRHRANGSRTSDFTVLAPRHSDRGPMVDVDPYEVPDEVADAARRLGEEIQPEDSSGEVFPRGKVRFSGSPEPLEEPLEELPLAPSPEVDGPAEVWRHYVAVMAPRNTTLAPDERKLIRDALKVATVDECKRAIDGCRASDFHMGKNDLGKKYNRLSQILKGKRGVRTLREQIDLFLDVSDRAKPEQRIDQHKLSRAKQEVMDGFLFQGDHVKDRAAKAEAWLLERGFVVIRDPNGRPKIERSTSS